MKTRAVCVLLLALAACAAPSVPVRYYALSAPPPAAPVARAAVVRLAIAAVTLPEAVDRPNLVLRTSPTRLEVLDNDRWAEGLRREIARLVAAQLNAQQGRVEVSYYPQAASDQADYLLDLDLERFDAERAKAVSLSVLWTLRGARGEAGALRSGRIQLSEPVGDASVDAIVDADGRALQRVAAELAGMLADLPTQGAKR